MTSAARFLPFFTKMQGEGLSLEQIARFEGDFSRYVEGDTGTIREEDIEVVDSLPTLGDLWRCRPPEADLNRLAVIKLNGGLGTSMGLDVPKGILEVKDGLSFLAIAALQLEQVRRQQRARLPLILMNSFATRDTSLEILQKYTGSSDLPLDFLQSRVPKIDAGNFTPAAYSADPEAEWCPPGHGEIYSALKATGLLQHLLKQGYHFVFVSNVDNLGATVDRTVFDWFVQQQLDFVMEVTQRTDQDRKGGHLARRKDSGRLTLREVAQCPPDQLSRFEDISRYRFFNTNNLWINLVTLESLESSPQLPLIVNRKTVNPADRASTPVVQLESAMGAAITTFANSQALEVDRSRFAPVKTTTDLFRLSSDLYRLDSEYHLKFVGENPTLPKISLDDRYFRNYNDCHRRFPASPVLRGCQALTIEGDIAFSGPSPVFLGRVHLRAERETVLEGPGPFQGETTFS